MGLHARRQVSLTNIYQVSCFTSPAPWENPSEDQSKRVKTTKHAKQSKEDTRPKDISEFLHESEFM